MFTPRWCSYSLTVPTLAQLGSTVPVPYFVAARARDISGNWTAPADFIIQHIEIIQDQPPGGLHPLARGWHPRGRRQHAHRDGDGRG